MILVLRFQVTHRITHDALLDLSHVPYQALCRSFQLQYDVDVGCGHLPSEFISKSREEEIQKSFRDP